MGKDKGENPGLTSGVPARKNQGFRYCPEESKQQGFDPRVRPLATHSSRLSRGP